MRRSMLVPSTTGPRRLAALVGALPAMMLACLLLGALAPTTAEAAGRVRLPPAVTLMGLQAPSATILGKDIAIVATLTDAAGRPLSQEHVVLFLGTTQIHSGRTDAAGHAPFTLKSKEIAKAGTYSIRAAYTGSTAYAPSSASGSFKVLPAAVQIQTVPAVAGLRFSLGTDTEVTGPDGTADFPVPTTGNYQITTDLNPADGGNNSVKASFVRWLDDVYTANRSVTIKGADTFVIGLRVAYRANIRYIDLSKQVVDPTLVGEARFSTGTGAADVILNSQVSARDVWWTAGSAVRRGTGLQVSPVTYRLLSARIGGADVVNRGQQFWTPTPDGTWTIQLLLYDMTVRTEDAFFGTPVTGHLELVYPDGEIRSAPVGANGSVGFSNLPRGQYQLRLKASAFTPPTPVALSRPQTATLRVITYLDVALAAGLFLFVLAVLALVGRRSQVARAVRWAVGAPGRVGRRFRRGSAPDIRSA